MADAYKVLSKGEYKRRKLGHFVHVKQFVMLSENGKKYLLLNFYNACSEMITGIDFKVIQYDKNGAELEKIPIQYKRLAVQPDSEFGPLGKISLNGKCADFAVELQSVLSDDYLYTVDRDEVSVTYCGEEALSPRRKNRKKKLSVHSRTARAAVCAVAILTVIAALSWIVIYKYMDNKWNNLHNGETSFGVTYEENSMPAGDMYVEI